MFTLGNITPCTLALSLPHKLFFSPLLSLPHPCFLSLSSFVPCSHAVRTPLTFDPRPLTLDPVPFPFLSDHFDVSRGSISVSLSLSWTLPCALTLVHVNNWFTREAFTHGSSFSFFSSNILTFFSFFYSPSILSFLNCKYQCSFSPLSICANNRGPPLEVPSIKKKCSMFILKLLQTNRNRSTYKSKNQYRYRY